jgi:hypothetical protein
MEIKHIIAQTKLPYILLVLATCFGLGRPKYLQKRMCTLVFKFYKYFGLMLACLGRNLSPNLIKYKLLVFDEIHILFHFNIILMVANFRAEMGYTASRMSKISPLKKLRSL